MRPRLFPFVHKLVKSPRGNAVGFVWGLAEALWWPIVPDYFVFGAAPTAPERWWVLAFFTSAGSVVGGAIGFWWAYLSRSAGLLNSAPLIKAGMVDQASSWLADRGALAVTSQPLSGIPYKVFVYLSGAGRLSFVLFLLASVVARALRIFAAAAISAGAAKLAGPSRVARYYNIFFAVYTSLFIYGLWRVVASYEG